MPSLILQLVRVASVMDTRTSASIAPDRMLKGKRFASVSTSPMDRIAKSVCRFITTHLGDALHLRTPTNASLATVMVTPTNATLIATCTI